VRKGVVFENWKYIVKVPRPPDEPEELYDLASDPKEKTNIAEQRPEVLRDMKSRLVRFEKTAKVFPREFTDAFITPEMAEGLKALGYVE
jgi:arylsulfatase A-like enzyme